jgi:aminoglycoside 3-N-acetyltransferase I
MNPKLEKLVIRQLTKEDLPAFKQLIHMFNVVFEESGQPTGSEAKLAQLLGMHQFIAIAAFFNTEVVGGLTAYELPMYYSENSEIFLYDLAVKPEFQRTGIGKRLIQELKKYCVTNGIKEFFVLAHEEDGHAIEFYHATGGRSEKVVNFLYEAAGTDE